MATTTNFGWETPDDTDLVKDGAAAIRTLGGAIDTSLVDLKGGTTGQVLSKASNTDMDFSWVTDATGIPATIFDAKGDIIAATAADTASRLAVGTNGHVLTADSTAATGLKWASPTSTTSYSLLSTTNLSGSAKVTISSLSGYNKLYGIIYQAKSATASNDYRLRPNDNATGANYNWGAGWITAASTYAASNFISSANNANGDIDFCTTSNNAASEVVGYFKIDGANSTGVKTINYAGYPSAGGGNGHKQYSGWTAYSEAAVISSISFRVLSGTFNAGSIYIYGAN